MLSMALMSQPSSEDESPSYVVRELDKRALRGDWDAAHRLFSYETKGRTVLPELWEPASQAERSAFVAFWRPQFRKGWERVRGGDRLTSDWALSEMRLSETSAVVAQTLTAADRGVVIRYWLSRIDGGWRVVDRTYLTDGVEHSGTPLVRLILQKITAQLGRTPTLGEFVANAPSWVGKVRAKSFRLR